MCVDRCATCVGALKRYPLSISSGTIQYVACKIVCQVPFVPQSGSRAETAVRGGTVKNNPCRIVHTLAMSMSPHERVRVARYVRVDCALPCPLTVGVATCERCVCNLCGLAFGTVDALTKR
jgi:hypothetical protein